MKKKLIEKLELIGVIITFLCVAFINTLLIKIEMFIVCCVLMGDVVICVMIIAICQEMFKSIIKFSKKRWRKSE